MTEGYSHVHLNEKVNLPGLPGDNYGVTIQEEAFLCLHFKYVFSPFSSLKLGQYSILDVDQELFIKKRQICGSLP